MLAILNIYIQAHSLEYYNSYYTENQRNVNNKKARQSHNVNYQKISVLRKTKTRNSNKNQSFTVKVTHLFCIYRRNTIITA